MNYLRFCGQCELSALLTTLAPYPSLAGRYILMVPMVTWLSRRTLRIVASLFLVILLSYGTYAKDYESPPHFFWDENYHVASAQKYLNGVFFMEAHPPLGKLLLALGEYLIDANPKDDQFLNTDHAKSPPPGFSFKGYRFFSVLLGFLTAPVFFFILLRLTRQVLWSVLLSTLYLFDTALILQARGAMLEGIQLFFVALTLLCYLYVARPPLPRRHRWLSAALGISWGLAMAVKINALVLLPLLLLPVYIHRQQLRAALGSCAISLGAALIVFCIPWYIHFSLGTTIKPRLPDSGFYQASAAYKEILRDGRTSSLSAFPTMLRDSFAFVAHYQRGVPKLNLSKDDENGSPAWWWPIGARSINYRWERKDNVVRYLFLQSNPAAWAVGLLGVLGAFALLATAALSRGRIKLAQPKLMFVLLALWGGYMGTMISIPRVMYLYHYFMPLLVSFMLAALVLVEIRSLGPLKLTMSRKSALLMLMAAAVLGGYWVYRPFAYALPLSDDQVRARALIGLWDLNCQGCPRSNGIAEPCGEGANRQRAGIYLGSLQAEGVVQDWGEPRMNRPLEDETITVAGTEYQRGIGVHAFSSLRFAPHKQYSQFSGLVGLPDYVAAKEGTPGSVIFEIFADGVLAWSSGARRSSEPALPFTVSLAGVDRLELVVKPAGSEITNCHAVWVNPELKGL